MSKPPADAGLRPGDWQDAAARVRAAGYAETAALIEAQAATIKQFEARQAEGSARQLVRGVARTFLAVTCAFVVGLLLFGIEGAFFFGGGSLGLIAIKAAK